MTPHTIQPREAPINGYRLVSPLIVDALEWEGACAGIYLSYKTRSGEKFAVRGANFGNSDYLYAESIFIHTLASRHKELREKERLPPKEQQTFDELSTLLQAA